MLTCSAPTSSLTILPPLRCHPAFDAVPVHPRLVVGPPIPLQPSASIIAHCCLTTRPLSKPGSSTSVRFLLPIRLTLPFADALQPFRTPLPSRHTTHPAPVPVNRCPSLYEKNRLRRCRSKDSLVRCCRRNRDDQQTTMQRSPTQSVKVKQTKTSRKHHNTTTKSQKGRRLHTDEPQRWKQKIGKASPPTMPRPQGGGPNCQTRKASTATPNTKRSKRVHRT